MRYIIAFLVGVIGTFAFAFFKVGNEEYWIFLAQNFFDYSFKILAWILGAFLVICFYFFCEYIFYILKKRAKERADEIIQRATEEANEMRKQAERYRDELTKELQEEIKNVQEMEKEFIRKKYAYKTEIDSLVYKNKVLKEALKNRYQKYLDINPTKRKLREIRKAYANIEEFLNS